MKSLLSLVLFGGVLVNSVNCFIIGRVTCDNIMEFYADGVLVESSSDWQDVSTVVLPDATQVLAFKCTDQGVVAGIKGFFSNGIKTDSSWKCLDTLQSGWETVGFDDSSWDAATIPDSSVWGIRPPSLNGYADWIWTSDGIADSVVYCRKVIPQVNFCSGLITSIGTSQALADAGIDLTEITNALTNLQTLLGSMANSAVSDPLAAIQALNLRLTDLFLRAADDK